MQQMIKQTCSVGTFKVKGGIRGTSSWHPSECSTQPQIKPIQIQLASRSLDLSEFAIVLATG